MSSYDQRTATPPPPPVTVTDSGEMYLSLGQTFGPSARAALGTLLDQLHENHEKFVISELGIECTSTLARTLAWKRVSQPRARVREYELAVSSELLPPDLSAGSNRSLTIRIQLTHTTLKLSHNYRVQTSSNQAQQVQERIQPAIQQVMARAFNPLAAVALQQQIKQRAEQRLRQEQRLQQQHQRLQTVVLPNLVIQTVGTVFAPRQVQGAK